MTIDFDSEAVFPSNAINLIGARLGLEDSRLSVLQRSLRTSDPNYSIGIYPTTWTPNSGTEEMLGILNTHEATLQQYICVIQVFVKHSNEEQGIVEHSILTQTIRSILASDVVLRSQLGGLQASVGGSTWRLKRWWVRSGRYLSGAVNGNNLYLATNDLILEVERVS